MVGGGCSAPSPSTISIERIDPTMSFPSAAIHLENIFRRLPAAVVASVSSVKVSISAKYCDSGDHTPGRQVGVSCLPV